MELSASERSALLLALTRYEKDGRGRLWGNQDAGLGDLDRLEQLGLVTLDQKFRADITPEGVMHAESYCPVCGSGVPHEDGVRPPHPARKRTSGGPGSWKGGTRDAPYWCPGGQSEGNRRY